MEIVQEWIELCFLFFFSLLSLVCLIVSVIANCQTENQLECKNNKNSWCKTIDIYVGIEVSVLILNTCTWSLFWTTSRAWGQFCIGSTNLFIVQSNICKWLGSLSNFNWIWASTLLNNLLCTLWISKIINTCWVASPLIQDFSSCICPLLIYFHDVLLLSWQSLLIMHHDILRKLSKCHLKLLRWSTEFLFQSFFSLNWKSIPSHFTIILSWALFHTQRQWLTSLLEIIQACGQAINVAISVWREKFNIFMKFLNSRFQ